MQKQRLAGAFFAAALITAPAAAQNFDLQAMEKWGKANIIHYEAVGEFTRKRVQIPPVDADLYATVTERILLSFDWDKNKKSLVGTPVIRNEPGKVSDIIGMGDKCPPGKINGPYEHFDVLQIKPSSTPGALELVGQRLHPDTMVAESCGKSLRPYKGAARPVSQHIAPPDPQMLAMSAMIQPGSPVTVSKDGKSIIMKSRNSNWVWTFTPSVK